MIYLGANAVGQKGTLTLNRCYLHTYGVCWFASGRWGRKGGIIGGWGMEGGREGWLLLSCYGLCGWVVQAPSVYERKKGLRGWSESACEAWCWWMSGDILRIPADLVYRLANDSSGVSCWYPQHILTSSPSTDVK